MNLIQSLWIKPCCNMPDTCGYNRFRGGWPTEKHYAISLAYSFSLLKKYNPTSSIHLYADDAGADWLVNRLGLDYHEVFPELDKLNHYDSMFWALPKLYAYGKQDAPFLHVDGDVFFWRPISDTIRTAPLVAQNLEINHEVYRELLEEATTGMSLPGYLGEWNNERLVTVNAGILGGTDVSFFREYARLAFDFVDQHQSFIINSTQKGGYNLLFEQLLFAQLAAAKYGGYEGITTLLNDNEGYLQNLIRFCLCPQIRKYAHMIGYSKSMPVMASHMEQRFRYEFPQLYQHIQQYYGKVSWRRTITPEDTAVHLFSAQLDVCRSFIREKGIEPEIFNVEVIELLLEEHLDHSWGMMLWDLYQIESCQLDVADFVKHEEQKDFDLLYNRSVDDFLDAEFYLNEQVGRVIYLFHKWEYTENDAAGYQLGKHRISCGPAAAGTLTPWFLSQTIDDVQLTEMNGWFGIYRFFEHGPEKGRNILEALVADKSETAGTLKDDLYDFLSSQAFLYNRLIPTAN